MVQFSPEGAYLILEPLIFFIIGLAVYTIIVFNIYKFVATRDIFNLNLRQYNKFKHPLPYKLFATILYFIEYILFFPLFLMIWFIVFSVLLIAITNTQNIQTILLFSMAIISSIRLISYYNQSLAKDIAKLLPFTLVAIFLTEGVASFFSWERSLTLIKQIPSLLEVLVYYFIFVISLELVLRVIYGISRLVARKERHI